MNRILNRSLTLALLLQAPTALADLCTVDDAPAGTLLYPAFEVDLQPARQLTTRVWIRNDDTEARLVQVTLWGDLHRPAFGFPVYIAAGATRRIDLHDVLHGGVLPSTGSAVSAVGHLDADGMNAIYSGCNATTDPGLGPPVANQITPAALSELQDRLTGARSTVTLQCYGTNYGDEIARGFITVDVVTSCSSLLPTDSGYFGPGGVAATAGANVLSGGFQFIHSANNFAQAGRAVALEVAQSGEFGAGDVSFFSRFAAGNPVDAREPLPGRWVVGFNEGLSSDSAELLLWRGVPNTASGAGCPFLQPPSWYPLGTSARVPFDAGGDTPLPGAGTPTPVGIATQWLAALEIDDTLQPVVQQGSALLALHASAAAYPSGAEGQAWVGARHYDEGRFSEFLPGVALDSFCASGKAIPANVGVPLTNNPVSLPYVFADNFEVYHSTLP